MDIEDNHQTRYGSLSSLQELDADYVDYQDIQNLEAKFITSKSRIASQISRCHNLIMQHLIEMIFFFFFEIGYP